MGIQDGPASPERKTVANSQVPDNEVVAYDKNGLKIILVCSKIPDGAVNITARFSNTLQAPMTDFLLEVAAPKTMCLTMQQAAQQVLPPCSDSVSQSMSVVNRSAKGLGLKFRIKYSCQGLPHQ